MVMPKKSFFFRYELSKWLVDDIQYMFKDSKNLYNKDWIRQQDEFDISNIVYVT